MVNIAGREIKDIHLVGVFLVILVTGYFGVWAATPGPSFPTDPSSVISRTEVALGMASVAEAGTASITVSQSDIAPSGQLFGTFEEPGTEINPGETVDYCADVEFKTTTDADYTYIGTYLSTSDFDFPEEGDTQWSDYHLVGSTVEICMPFTAPGGGTYDQSMWLDSISERAYAEGRIDEDTFTVEGETDSPPEIRDMNCPSTAQVGETVTISPDVDDDTGISRWYWDATDHYGNSGDDTAYYDWESTGTKTVELTVTDQAGQTDYDSCTINVEEQTTDPSDVSGNTVLDFIGSATAAIASLF